MFASEGATLAHDVLLAGVSSYTERLLECDICWREKHPLGSRLTPTVTLFLHPPPGKHPQITPLNWFPIQADKGEISMECLLTEDIGAYLVSGANEEFPHHHEATKGPLYVVGGEYLSNPGGTRALSDEGLRRTTT